VKLTDDITVGVEVSTFGNGAATQRYTTLGQNQDLGLGFSKAYIQWTPSQEFSVIAGRQAVPFYSTEMVWDRDVRLDGVTEKIDLGKLLGLGDGVGLKLVSGQFIGGDNLAFNAKSATGGGGFGNFNNGENQDAWFYQTQLQASADLGGAKLTVAPGFLWSNGSGGNAVNGKELIGTDLVGPFGPGGAFSPAENMAILLLPGDISFDVSGVKTKFYWDFAYNYNAGGVTSHDDNVAYLAGLKVGQNKAKGDFAASIDYRQVGANAVNGLYSDSDFGLGQLNQRGFKVAASYSLTANATLTAAYTVSNNIDKDALDSISQAAPGGAGGKATLNSTQLITIDLGVKF
jgi:hypothetical protein